MSLLYKKLIKIKSQSIFEKNAIITSDESKINYQALIQKINFLSNNIKNTTKANNFLILLENSIEAIILIFAISKNNGGTVILDYDIKKDQIVKIIKDTNCFNLITDLSKKKIFSVYKLKNVKIHFIENLLKKKIKKKNNFSLKKKLKSKYFLTSFSSGSTGEPKPIRYTEKCKFLRSVQSKKLFNIKTNDKIICYTPIHHSLALRITFLSLINHTTLIFMKKFNFFKFTELVSKYKVSVIFPISSHLEIMYNFIKKPEILKNLNIVVASSANASISLKKKLYSLLKNRFVEIYGLSEMAIVSILRFSDVKLGYLRSVGKIVPGVKVKIANLNGQKKNDDKKGNILCRSPYMSGFEKNEIDDKKIFNENYLNTGDLGSFKKKWLFFEGRDKDIIIRSGVNIYPKIIENVLSKEILLTNVMVIAGNDQYFGEAPIAICEIKKNKSKNQLEKKLIKLVNQKLPKVYHPAGYFFEKKLKVSKMGKVNKQYYTNKYKDKLKNNISKIFKSL